MSDLPIDAEISRSIDLITPHARLGVLQATGVVRLADAPDVCPEGEWRSLDFLDWKSGGDTHFAPLASVDGEMNCVGFSSRKRADKDGIWTINAERAPSLRRYVEGVGANFGRVRVIRLNPQGRAEARTLLHRDQNNRHNPPDAGWVVRSWLELTDNPDSYMMLMDNDADGYPDPATEIRIPLHRGSRFVVDTQRLWHVVVHRGDQPRHALISSFESGPELDGWIRRNRSLPARLAETYPAVGKPLKAAKAMRRRFFDAS
ncbi:MAG: hypothetical protein R2704_05375 [Microthrixaceae bacterium]|nr:hypothetical protein [Microthrixaceae bacterium]